MNGNGVLLSRIGTFTVPASCTRTRLRHERTAGRSAFGGAMDGTLLTVLIVVAVIALVVVIARRM